MFTPLWNSLRLGVRQLASRRIYLVSMILIPLFSAFFFVSLLQKGLPTRVPTAVVDLDHSPMSRAMIRQLDAVQLVDITEACESYDKGLQAVRTGRVFGFYVIPADFQKDALSGRTPVIDYYSNMTYFVPGTFSYKGYKTVAVQVAAGLVSQKAVSMGVTPRTVNALVQPMAIDINPIHNPWTDYSLYLSPSFVAAILELMIVLVTIFSITTEIKNNTSRRWLATADNSIMVALAGKLWPQTVIFCIVGWCIQAIMFGFAGFPMACPLWEQLLAMAMFVCACQGLGVFISCVLPNPRFALSIGALFSILAFSFTGFSFPVQNMYGAIAIFSWIMPVRYYFLIHITEALNGCGLYYARMYYVALALFVVIAPILVFRLKRAMMKPIYVP